MILRRPCFSRPKAGFLALSVRHSARSVSTICKMASDSISSSMPGPETQQQQTNGTDYSPRYIDIGINLADPIFRGIYHGKSRHPDDLSAVVSRAQEVGCSKLIITGSDFTSSRHAIEIAKEYRMQQMPSLLGY